MYICRTSKSAWIEIEHICSTYSRHKLLVLLREDFFPQMSVISSFQEHLMKWRAFGPRRNLKECLREVEWGFWQRYLALLRQWGTATGMHIMVPELIQNSL